jgi:hypothetical protein
MEVENVEHVTMTAVNDMEEELRRRSSEDPIMVAK